MVWYICGVERTRKGARKDEKDERPSRGEAKVGVGCTWTCLKTFLVTLIALPGDEAWLGI